MSDSTQEFYTMSDEDFMDVHPSQFQEAADEPSEVIEDAANTAQESDEVLEEPEDTEEEYVEDEADSEDQDDSLYNDNEDDTDDEEEDEEQDKAEEDSIDYQAEVNKLLSPFKANGTDIQVNNVDEAIKLMQMGANYSKKMSALKPNLRLMKMLENNELLSEDKLSLLIDVASGDPKAISKLVKDKGIDPMDLDPEDSKYTPKNHTVGDNEVELDDVISRIQDSDSFSDTMNVVSNKWDEASKRSIAAQPQLLEVINQHVSNGIYAKVEAEIARKRVFGELGNLSDLEAYKTVGDEMIAAGKLDFGKPAPNKVIKTAPKSKQNDDKLKTKRKAASPAKNSKPTTKAKSDFNPLAMSDEEFEKLLN